MALYRSSLDTLPIKALSDHAIVLDLDESLVHSSEDMTDLRTLRLFTDLKISDIKRRTYVITLDDVIERRGSGVKTQLWGVTRPHLDEFLVFCFSYFKVVAVWSAGQPKYVDAIVQKIFGDITMPHIVYSWTNCDTTTGIVEKPLSKMISQVPGLDKYMSLSSTLVVDDRKTTFQGNSHNGILIPPYNPRPTIDSLREEDIALLQLKTWLERSDVRESSDVRILDKSRIFATPLNVLRSDTEQSIISNTLFTSSILPEQPKTPRSPYLPKGCYQSNGGIMCDPNLTPPLLLDEPIPMIIPERVVSIPQQVNPITPVYVPTVYTVGSDKLTSGYPSTTPITVL